MSLYSPINVSRSGLLTVVIDIDRDENDCDLVSVKGNKKKEHPDVLSDVEWFRKEWSVGGSDLVFAPDEWPESGKYRMKGYLHCWQNNTPDDQDYDLEFEIDSFERIGK